MAAKLSYCGELVKQYDPDRFLLSLFAPASVRDDLWALFAFNHEIAKTREVVSETQLGLIRLQWWRDAIGKIYDPPSPEGFGATGVPKHEVVQPLVDVIARRDLRRDYFEALIYAREFDLEDVMPTRLEGTLTYADYTTTPLMRLVMQVMGDDPEEADALQPVAMNYALVGLLRAVPFHAAQKRCYLPEELMHQYGVRRLYELKPEGDLKSVISEVAECFLPAVQPKNRFLRASQNLAFLYLRQLQACHYDVFDPKMRRPLPFKELRLCFSMIF